MAVRGPCPIRVGTLEVEPGAYRASLGGDPLRLSPGQIELLAYLVANCHRVVSRDELARAAGFTGKRSVDVALSLLRCRLPPGVLRNVRNRGWILEPRALGG